MNDNEIIKALECCNNPPGKADCRTCPFYHSEGRCTENMLSNALDLINRLQAEIERLKGWQDLLKAEKHSLIKAEARKEARKAFAERLIGKYAHHRLDSEISLDAFVCDIKHLLEEMEKEDNNA